MFCAPRGSIPCLFLCCCSDSVSLGVISVVYAPLTTTAMVQSCEPSKYIYTYFGVCVWLYFYLISFLISSKGYFIFASEAWPSLFLLLIGKDFWSSRCLSPLTDGPSKVHGESHEVPQINPWVVPELLCLLLAWLLFLLPAHSSCHPPSPVKSFYSCIK